MPPNDNIPRLPNGEIDYDKLAAMSFGDVAASTPAATPSGALGSASNPYTNNNYVPQPRDAYGPYLQGDIANRTVQIDAKTRADPYTGQRYTMGSDNTWRDSGFLSRTEQAAMRAEAPLAPVGQGWRDSTVNGGQMSANPSLRPNAALAGYAGGLGPQDTPHFPSLSDYRMPGLGFDQADFRQVNTNNINLGSTRLPTAVADRPYGFDFGTSQALGGQQGGARTSGPAMLQASMPNFQVPNSYQSGPSGFSIPAGNGQGSAFAPVALPFGASNPTFSPLSQSAPAQVMPGVNGGPATAAGTQPGGQPTGPALGAPNGLLGGGPSLTNPQISQQAGGGLTVNGINLPAQSVQAVMQSNWAKSPEAIPQALALMARESGGDPTKDNSKGYQGGPLNNDPQFHNPPGSPGYNTIDYGLFQINDSNFKGLGLTPETAKDPVANANAAYQMYESSLKGPGGAWSPWTGGGTVPLPAPATNVPALPPAGLKATTDNPYFLPSAQQLAGQPSRATAGNPYYLPSAAQLGQEGKAGLKATPSDPYFLPTPDQLRLGAGSGGGAGGAGGAAGGGAAGAGGFQSQAIGQGDLKPAGMLTPGGAGVAWLNGPQTVNINGGLSPDGKTSMGFGFNPTTILEGYGKSGDPQLQDAATRAIAAMSLMNTNSEAQIPKAQGGMGMTPLDAFIMMNTPSTSNYGAPQGSTNQAQGDDQRDYGTDPNAGAYGPDGPMRFAAGGSITADPGLQLPLDSGRATPAVVAPLDNGNQASGMAQPRYTPQGQQQAQQATYLDSTAQAAAPSNSEGAIAPISNQGTTNQQPVSNSNQLQGAAPAQADQSQFTLDSGAGANDPTGMLNPYRDALAQLGAQARQRSYDSNRYSMAGLSAPTGIDTLGGQAGTALPPGMFWDPSGAIKGRVNDITNLQSTIAGLGNPGSIESLTNQEIPVQNLQQLFATIQSEQQKLAALGPMGDPTALHSAQAALQAQLAGLGTAQSAQTALGSLGPQADMQGLLSQQSSYQQMLDRLNQAQKLQLQLQGLGNTGDPVALAQQEAALQAKINPLQDIQNKQETLAAYGPLMDAGQMAQQQASIDALKSFISQAQQPTSGSMQWNPTTNQWMDTGSVEAGYFDIGNNVWRTVSQMEQGIAGMQNNIQKSQSGAELQSQLQQLMAAQGITGDVANQLGAYTANMSQIRQQESDAANAAASKTQLQNQLNGLVDPGTDINGVLAKYQGLMSPLQQQIADAQNQAKLRSDYTNQLTSLGYDPSTDLASLMGGVQSQLDPLNQQVQNLNTAQDLQSQIANLQQQTAGQTQGGVEAQMTQLTDALNRARQLQSSQSTLSNLVSQGVPGVNPATGKLPGFAQGGRIQAGNFGPGANDVQGYTPPPNSSGKNLAGMMRQMGPLGVTQAQWDPNWNIKMNPAHFANGGQVMAGISGILRGGISNNERGGISQQMRGGITNYAGGGQMTTPEEIVGIGRYSGKPYFRVGEAGPERLTVQPLTGPNKIPMGVMNRAAA